MDAGKMDRKITIQQVTETRSTTGDVVETWATLARVSALIKPVQFRRGFEQDQGPGLQAREVDTFQIRWRNDVTNKHRILFTPFAGADPVIYNILSVAEIGRRDGLEIVGRAKVT